MCLNFLEKISKEERELESGGMEGLVVKWRRKRDKFFGIGVVVLVVVKRGYKRMFLFC